MRRQARTDRWTDPRTNPAPPYRGPQRPLARAPEEITGLIAAIREGRFYEGEAWVAAGEPLQLHPAAAKPYNPSRRTPLGWAMATGQLDLMRLLLCNGYRTELEPDSPLDDALAARRRDMLDLLLTWGADPAAADRGRIFDTYARDVFERFLAAGIDLAADGILAGTLSRATSNRPLYGFVRAHREKDPRLQRALDAALGEAVAEDRGKAVSLCLWAGANPRRRIAGTPEEDADGLTAIEEAVLRGRPQYLKTLGFDPRRDPVQPLYRYAHDLETLRTLTAIEPPRDWTRIVTHLIHWLRPSERLSIRLASLEDLAGVFGLGARVLSLDRQAKKDLRQLLINLPEHEALRLFRLLKTPAHMEPEAFIGLIAHEKLAARYMEAPKRWGIDKRLLAALESSRRAPAPLRRQAKAKLHPVRAVPTDTFLGPVGGQDRAYTREELYELVWSEPITAVAARFGISDNGLRKRCRAMRVPTPPRGYWERRRRDVQVPRTPLPPLD